MLELDGVELEFEQEALEQIADTTLARKTGARGLRSIVENRMLDISYELPSIPGAKEVVIDKENILEGIPPRILGENNNLLEFK